MYELPLLTLELNNITELEEDEYDNWSGPSDGIINFTVAVKLGGSFVMFFAEIYLAIATFMIIYRFKKSDNIIADVFIFNSAILAISNLATSVLIFLDISLITYCLLFQIELDLTLLYFTFALLLACHWFLYNVESVSFIKNVYMKYWKYLLTIVYLAFVCHWVVSLSLCISTFSTSKSGELIVATNIFSCLFVTIMYILKKNLARKNISSESDYVLHISGVIVFSYLPLSIYVLCLMIFNVHRIIEYILVCTLFIPLFLEVMHPMLIIYILVNQSKYYKIAWRKMCCRKTADQDHEPMVGEENEDEEQCVNNI